jgi:hypothetical protein
LEGDVGLKRLASKPLTKTANRLVSAIKGEVICEFQRILLSMNVCVRPTWGDRSRAKSVTQIYVENKKRFI